MVPLLESDRRRQPESPKAATLQATSTPAVVATTTTTNMILDVGFTTASIELELG
jgi:hypothetical protein